MSLTVTSAPSVEPVTTAEAKEWLRIDSSDTSQDAVLAILIKAARVRVEEYLRRSLITRTYSWEMNGDDMRDRIEIPRPPVQSVTSLTIYDENSAGVEISYTEAAENWQRLLAVRDAVVLNVVLDSPRVPGYALDYIMYHELLHRKHGVTWRNGQARVHTAQFKEDERRFPQLAAAQRLLAHLSPERRR